MRIDLSGKRALVTGGSGDIGRAICRVLAAAGAEVAFTYFSNRDGADATSAAIAEAGGTSHVVRANFSDAKNTALVAPRVREAMGGVDVFVSNAASGVLRSATELKERHWQWTVDINAKAFFTLVQALVAPGDEMMGSGGRIVAMSSLGASRAIPQYTAVGASKAALEALVRHFALELGPRGIRVNAVSPGIVDTGALAHFPNRDQLLDVARSRTPAGRLTTADDVAGVVAFLCAPEAQMIHGQTIHVDGGYSVVA